MSLNDTRESEINIRLFCEDRKLRGYKKARGAFLYPEICIVKSLFFLYTYKNGEVQTDGEKTARKQEDI